MDLSTLYANYDPTKNMSPRFLTKYERTAIIGTRTEQLFRGAPSVLSTEELKGLVKIDHIVEKELQSKKLPFMLLRALPGGIKELWKLDDLSLDEGSV